MKKLLLLICVICSSLILSSCSFSVSFIVENLSPETILVKYEAKNSGQSNLIPYIIKLNAQNKKDKEWQQAAQEDYKLDKEKGIVEVNLHPNQGLQVASGDPFYINKEPYGDHFNLKNLSITGANGSIKFEGNQVFDNFKPEGYSWFTRSPSNYKITYK